MLKRIEVYTSDTCPNCVKLKEFLKNHNVNYEEYNISKESKYRKKLIEEGFLSVPVMKIDEDYVLGFDIFRIEQLLELKK